MSRAKMTLAPLALVIPALALGACVNIGAGKAPAQLYTLSATTQAGSQAGSQAGGWR